MTIPLADGSSVRVAEGGAEILDPMGRVRIRYKDGSAEVIAPEGDLTFAAPEGRVVVRSGRDISLIAERDVQQRAGRGVEITAGVDRERPQIRVGTSVTEVDTERLEVKATVARAVAEQASVIANRIVTTAATLSQAVERFELSATQIVERARDTFRETADLAQTRAGRVRTIVDDLYAVYSRRTAMQSKDETSIDGSKVLLG
jgi:hypothetical protein